MRRNSCQDFGHSLDLEVKKGGTNHVCQNLEEMELRDRTNATTVRGDSPPNFHRFQFSESWSSPKILKKKSFIRFNAESSNVELLFRIIHSANQLSGYGAVSSWSGQHSLAGAEILRGLGMPLETGRRMTLMT